MFFFCWDDFEFGAWLLEQIDAQLGLLLTFCPCKNCRFRAESSHQVLDHLQRALVLYRTGLCQWWDGTRKEGAGVGQAAEVLPGTCCQWRSVFFFWGGRGGAAVGKPKEISVKLRNFELQLVSANANADRANHCFINRSIDTKHPRLCSKVNSCSTVTGETRHWAISCCAPHHPFTCPSSAWTKIYRI